MVALKSLVAPAALLLLSTVGQAAELSPQQRAFREIYQELVEINTTDSIGDTTKAAEAMAARLRAAGLADTQVLSSGPRKGNLVARLRGTGARRPILLIAHIDVVEAKREDWEFDPFKLQEVDGEFRARGVIDDKAMAAAFVANLIEYVKEGFRPDRDIIVALTADEELSDSPHDGAHWLLQNHRALIDAELAINEGGGGSLRDGRPVRMSIQLAEKVYQSYRLEVTDPGGHSAAPRPENAIYRLAQALTRLAQFEFPISLNAVTRAYFERVAAAERPDVAAAITALLAGKTDDGSLAALTHSPTNNALLRTTCVATMLNAGEAENALPQTARATVNCRLMPGQPPGEVEAALNRAINDPKVAVTPLGQAVESPPSPINPDVMQAVERIAGEMWPGVPVIPIMSGGYTDSRWLRNAGIPAYGVSGLFSEGANSGVHGRNEHVGVKQVYDSKEFLYRLVKALAGSAAK
ncbi:MAG: M20/M25/M40 family metallo-hydrolase [Xanthobacteraceae bacterium]|jgi:acetylornithine deacetylase/succinyl-diaminopimelate desuccinylase-like protein